MLASHLFEAHSTLLVPHLFEHFEAPHPAAGGLKSIPLINQASACPPSPQVGLPTATWRVAHTPATARTIHHMRDCVSRDPNRELTRPEERRKEQLARTEGAVLELLVAVLVAGSEQAAGLGGPFARARPGSLVALTPVGGAGVMAGYCHNCAWDKILGSAAELVRFNDHNGQHNFGELVDAVTLAARAGGDHAPG